MQAKRGSSTVWFDRQRARMGDKTPFALTPVEPRACSWKNLKDLEQMKRLIASASVAAITAMTAGIALVGDITATNTKADSAVEAEEFTNKTYPEGRGSKNYADVEPVADDNGADAPTTSEAQGGRDEAVYKDKEATTATN